MGNENKGTQRMDLAFVFNALLYEILNLLKLLISKVYLILMCINTQHLFHLLRIISQIPYNILSHLFGGVIFGVKISVTFFLIQFSTKKIGSTKVMSYTYAIPFWVAILSGLLLDNWPPLEIGIGGILIASALIFLMRDDLGKS